MNMNEMDHAALAKHVEYTTWGSMILRFFNINYPAMDDMKYLSIVRMKGIPTADSMAEEFHWNCEAARKALHGIMTGPSGVFTEIPDA